MKKALLVVAFMLVANSAYAAGRPAHCPPRAWCGCYLASVMGIANAKARGLWRALAWTSVGQRVPKTAAQPGDIVVWARGRGRGHVGKIVKVTKPGYAVVLSGNDGNRVRARERRIYNAYAMVRR